MYRALLFILFGTVPAIGFAKPVINELLWMGSDAGTTDEWVELWNPDADAADLSGWSLSVLSSKGEEKTVVSFETGTVVEPGAYIVIARKGADASALSNEPFIVTSSFSLLNSGLLVRLRDANGNTVDEADDGAGVPFAGENPSGTGAKASMERIDPAVSGTVKSNWRSASEALGMDAVSTTLATPGFPNSSPPFVPPAECRDDLTIGIAVQSGDLFGIGKVTVNFQAVALTGTLPSLGCRWSYGDGFVSSSCNPPSHTFVLEGSHTVHLEVTNRCGVVLTKDQQVEVLPDPKRTNGTTWHDGSRLVLKAVLPNPEGADSGKEWVEVRNLETRAVSLNGWKLKIGETSAKWYALTGDIGASSVLRVYGTEVKFTLPNSPANICLATPAGTCVSHVAWKTAEEGREYFSTDLREVTVRGTVLRVIGSTVLEVQLDPAAANVLGEPIVYVKLLGIEPFQTTDMSDQTERMEYLEALVKGKKVELEFDTEMWDELGRLRAYAYTDGPLSVQEQLLVTGRWTLDRTADFSRKELFSASEKKELVAELFSEIMVTDEALLEEKIAQAPVAHDPAWDGIRFSEIFASPSPAASGGLLSEEWIEFASSSQAPVSLSGFVLQTGSKKKALGSGLFVSSGSLLVVSMTALKLPLKNGGDALALFAPDGVLVASAEYPKLGHSVAYASVDEDYCVTQKPTPGSPNICMQAGKKKTAKKSTSASPAVRAYASFYAAQLQGEQRDISFASEEEGADALLLLFLSFALGLGFGVLPMLLRQKRHADGRG